MGRWSNPKHSREVDSAPNEKGVYQIGFYRGKTFNPKYIGMTSKQTIKRRLKQHFSGTGSLKIKEYLDSHKRNDLYFRTMRVKNPVKLGKIEVRNIALNLEIPAWINASSNFNPSFKYPLNFPTSTNPSFTIIPINAIIPSQERILIGRPCT